MTESVPATGSALVASNLRKVYRGRAVVDGVDLEITQGEIVGLLGPNGAGKTTSFYMIVGFIPPDGGEVHLDGKDLSRLPMYKRARLGIGYLPQESSIFRRLSFPRDIRRWTRWPRIRGPGAGLLPETSGGKTTKGPTVEPSTPRGASADCAFGDSLVRRTYASR